MAIVGKKLFGRKWKFHEECKDKANLDALPQNSNVRQVNKSIEAMALAEIVKEIMDSNGKVSGDL